MRQLVAPNFLESLIFQQRIICIIFGKIVLSKMVIGKSQKSQRNVNNVSKQFHVFQMMFEQIEASVSFDVFYKVMEARNLQIQQQVRSLSTIKFDITIISGLSRNHSFNFTPCRFWHFNFTLCRFWQ